MKKTYCIRMAMSAVVVLFLLSLTGCAGGYALSGDPSGVRPASGPAWGTMGQRHDGGDETDSDPPALTADSSLEDYFNYALKSNEALRSAYAGWEAAAQRPRQARTLPDPRISFEADDRFNTRELSLMQTFPWYGKRGLRAEAAESAALAQYFLYRAEIFSVFSALRAAYADYYYLERAVEITEENLALLEHYQEVVRRRFETGEAPHSSLVRIEVETEGLRDRLQQLKDRRAPRRAALNRVLGRPHNALLPPPAVLPVDREHRFGAAALSDIAVEHNPRLLALRHGVDELDERVKLAGREYYPDITVGVVRREERGGEMGNQDMNMGMISLDIPLWRRSYGSGVREARAMLNKQRHSLADAEYMVEAGLQDALFTLNDARRRIGLYEDYLLVRAEELLRATETAYGAGEADISAMLDAQRQMLNLELELERARSDHFLAVGDIERLTGLSVTEIETMSE